MTTPEHNYGHRFLVVRAVDILAAALGPVVADMATAKGFERYRAGDGGERPRSTQANTPDAATVLEVMLDCWGEVFQPYFGDDKHWEVRQIVCNLRSIASYYVGQRDGAECDYEPYEALGEIARLLRRFYIDHAARQVDEVKRELGGLMYGQPTGGAQSADGDNVVVTKDALEALIADAVSLEVARQLRSELDRVGLRPPDADAPPIPGTVSALPTLTVPPVSASSDADAAPVEIPASAVGDATLVSTENVRMAHIAFNNGFVCADRGEYDQAIADFTAAIELNPQYAQAYNNRGLAYLRQGDYDRAIADCTTAIRLNPQYVEAYKNRGFAYYRQGEYNEAIVQYTDAIELGEQLAEGTMRSSRLPPKSHTAIELGQQVAEAHYNRGVVFYIEAEGGLDRGVLYYGEGEYGHAVTDFTAAIELDPQYVEAYNSRGLAYRRQGDYDRAIADYTNAIRLNPQDAQAYYNRGVAYSEQGKYERAIADYTVAIGLNPQLAQAYRNRGLAYAGRRDYDQAIADYTVAIGLNPQLAQTYRNRGLAYAGRRDYDQAIADYTVAIALNPQDAQAYRNRGLAYFKQEWGYDQAIADYTAAIGLNPQDAMAYYNRSVLHSVRDNREQAAADLERARELGFEV